MSQPPFEPPYGNRLLTQIYEGMTVYDRAGEKIGTVEHVYLGEVSKELDQHGGGPGTVPSPERSRAGNPTPTSPTPRLSEDRQHRPHCRRSLCHARSNRGRVRGPCHAAGHP
jgi:hypothetical protein